MKSIKDVYSQVESDKSNAVSSPEMKSMPLDDFFDEHLELIKVLREGSREELLAEAKDQEDELEQCLKDHGMTMQDIMNDGDNDEDDSDD